MQSSSLPILDVLLKALINDDQASLAQVQRERAAECAAIRAVISTDQPGGIDLDLGLGVTSNEYVTPFFAGPRLFFMSGGISLQAALAGGTSQVPLDYSLSFDSNFAKEMKAVIDQRNVDPPVRERVLSVLRLKAQNQAVQFDLLPFLIENTRLIRDDTDNRRPLDTLIAFRMLDHLDWNAFREQPDQLAFVAPPDILKEALRPEAARFLQELCASEDVRNVEAGSLATHALLLRFGRLVQQLPQRPTAVQVLHELMSYSILQLGSLQLSELRLIWRGLTLQKRKPFLGAITGQSDTLLTDTRSMAWDMTLLRVLERSATTYQSNAFFLPYFVSVDQRWRDLLRLTQYDLMLVDDSRAAVMFAHKEELAFQHALQANISDTLRSEFTPEKVQARRLAARNPDVDRLRRLVDEETEGWEQGTPL